MIVNQPVPAAGPGGELLHDLLDDPGYREVEGVRRLARLEEDVGVLGRPPNDRSIRRHPAGAQGQHVIIADQRADVVLFEHGDLVDLVRGAEAVEEVEERDPGAQRRRMGYERKVVCFLDRACREHRPTGRSRVHHIAVVAKDRERMGRDRPCRDMDHRRRQLAGDLEHVGDHQQESLGRGERRPERALLERAVQRSGRASLGLHLDDVRHLPPEVRPARRRPIVAVFGHGGGGGDRVDRDHFADGVGDAGRCFVAVQALVPLLHVPASFRESGWWLVRGGGMFAVAPSDPERHYPPVVFRCARDGVPGRRDGGRTARAIG